LSGWTSRIEFTVDSSKIDSALSDFPLMLNVTDAEFWQDMGSGDSLKIAITEDDALTECYAEVEKWDDSANRAIIWFKAPDIASGSDQKFYLYYDSGHADNTTYIGALASAVGQNVWDANFEYVAHLAHGGDQTQEDSAGSHDFTPQNLTSSDDVPAKIGGGIQFPDSNDYLNNDTGYENVPDTEHTIEGWAWADSIRTTGFNHIVIGYDGTAGLYTSVALRTNNKKMGCTQVISESGYVAADTNDFPTEEWVYVCGHWKSGEKPTVYINTTKYEYASTVSGAFSRSSERWDIGAWHTVASREWDGKIDEVRYSSIRRSDAWIKASYHSGNDSLIQWVGVNTSTTTTTSATT
jgi:hypothetical protein